MTVPPPDGSRDRRIEDLSNLHLIHPAARALLPLALARHVSANAVSCAGLAVGAGAAAAFTFLPGWPGALGGLALAAGWLVLDGLDGMVARATGTSSRLGRILDGLCDHGVFLLIYLGLAWSVGTVAGWALAFAAGAAHAVQSSLYEGERARFHRRLRREPPRPAASRVPVYDRVAGAADRAGAPLDAAILGAGGGPVAAHYGAVAAVPMGWMAWLSANVRVGAVALAVALRDPPLFWWFELVPLTLVAAGTMAWHRHAEAGVLRAMGVRAGAGLRAGSGEAWVEAGAEPDSGGAIGRGA